MQAFEAEAVTEKDLLETNFEATRFAATARETLDPVNLRRQFALRIWLSSPAASPRTSALLAGGLARPGAHSATKAAADCFTARRRQKDRHIAWQARSDPLSRSTPAPRYCARDREERTGAAA